MGIKFPSYNEHLRSAVLFTVGIFIAIYNTTLGDHNWPTFIVALTFCGLAPALNLDELISKKAPVLVPIPEAPADPVKEVVP